MNGLNCCIHNINHFFLKAIAAPVRQQLLPPTTTEITEYSDGYFDASIGLAPKTKITPSILENQTEKGF